MGREFEATLAWGPTQRRSYNTKGHLLHLPQTGPIRRGAIASGVKRNAEGVQGHPAP